MKFISENEINNSLDWSTAINVLRDRHNKPRCHLENSLLNEPDRFILTRTANVADLAAGVKVAMVKPDKTSWNPPQKAEQAIFILIDCSNWTIKCILDGVPITAWKTAADSALGSSILSRENSKTMLMVGAGHISRHLIEAHLCARQQIQTVQIWNRTHEKAVQLSESLSKLNNRVNFIAVRDLADAASNADIICCATNSNKPLILGDWITPGTHIDLVGAFNSTMREVDDQLICNARVFVNCRDTTIDHCGDLVIPIKSGVLNREAIQADLYEMVKWPQYLRKKNETTVYKNGGGGHIDMMIAEHVYQTLTTSTNVNT